MEKMPNNTLYVPFDSLSQKQWHESKMWPRNQEWTHTEYTL